MIVSALSHIANQLNQYLRRSFDLNEDIAVVSNILEQDGSLVPNINNKLVIFLINIEKATEASRARHNGIPGSDRSVVSYPPLYLNLYFIIAANFSGNNYTEALKFLSHTIGFFQRRPVFDHQSTPDLDRRIDKLVLDMENLNIQDLSTLWGAISGRYLPSVIYKVRMATFDAADVVAQVSVIKTPQTSVN